MKIAICDDNKLFCNQVAGMIRAYMSEHRLEAELTCFHSGIALIENGDYSWDAIFLDISMDGLDGISTAKKIREHNKEMLIVFITSFVEFSLQGYEVEAVRYILKSQLEQHFADCMDYLIEKLSTYKTEITLKFTEGIRSVFLEEIVYIESRNHRLSFNLEASIGEQETLHIYDKLDKYEPDLIPKGFLRIHKSYMVNMDYISSIRDYSAILRTGQVLPIPKTKFTDVKRQYVLYKGAR